MILNGCAENVTGNTMEEKEENKSEIEDNGARLDIFRIEASHCYMCLRLMSKEKGITDNCKSMHHAIPRFLKPKRNVLIPICISCHRKINQYSVQSVPKKPKNPNFNIMIDKITSIKKGIDREQQKITKAIEALNKYKEIKDAKTDKTS